MFATHYHELCALAESHPRVRNFQAAVREWKGEVVFLHKLVPGGAAASYGIEVARLAGLPAPVLVRAREILAELERGRVSAGGPQMPLFEQPRADGACLAVLAELRAVDPNQLTPIAALALLDDLRRRLPPA
jgi:DNA mismatch repair protein MutS